MCGTTFKLKLDSISKDLRSISFKSGESVRQKFKTISMNAEENSGNVCFVGYMATRLPVGGREGKGDSNKHWKIQEQ